MTKQFKVGDKVRCIEGFPGYFTAGKTYTVTEALHHNLYPRIKVALDDEGHTTNGWLSSKFVLVTEPAIKVTGLAFKVGDRVIVNDYCVKNAVGTIVSSADLGVTGYEALVYLDEKHTYGYSWESIPQGHGRYVYFKDLKKEPLKGTDITPGRKISAAGITASKIAPLNPPKAPSRGTFIVVLRAADGGLWPADRPKTHATQAEAEKEAKRLAEKVPGQDYVVFHAVTSVLAPAPVAAIKAL